MKQLRDFAKTLTDALDVIERKATAEEHCKTAQQAAARALANAESAKLAAEKTKAESDSYVRECEALGERKLAAAKAAQDAENAQHEGWLANTKKHEAEAGERHAALQSAIIEAAKQLEAIEAKLAKHRASIAEFAKL